MARTTVFASGEWYHCFNGGIDRRRTFLDRKDFQRFQKLLYICNSTENLRISSLRELQNDLDLEAVFEHDKGEPLVDIGAYSLMPDRYHVLVRERVEGGISTFMRKLGTAYTMYFNHRHNRIGALFTGRFRSLHVDKSEHLQNVVNYIHGNPSELFEPGIKIGRIVNIQQLRKNVCSYEFSSLHDYEYGRRAESKILTSHNLDDNLRFLPSITGALEDFQTHYSMANIRLRI